MGKEAKNPKDHSTLRVRRTVTPAKLAANRANAKLGGNIVEFHHIRGKLPAQLVNAWHQSFEMIAGICTCESKCQRLGISPCDECRNPAS